MTKTSTPSNNPCMYNLQVNGVTKKTEASPVYPPDDLPVSVGSNPSVGETAGTGSNLSDYESSIACSGDSEASSSTAGPLSLGTLPAGDVVDCTITNKRKPQMKVTKSLTTTDDPGKFNLQVD